MPSKDTQVTVKGDATFVTQISILPHEGSVVIRIAGQTKDSEGRVVVLKEAQLFGAPKQNEALDDLLTMGVTALRMVNGLEEAPDPVVP